MKKLFLLLSLVSIVFASCSSDDGTTSEPELTTNGTILKRTISSNGPSLYSSDYYYNGNKLQKIVSTSGETIQFTYTGNLITKTEYYDDGVLKEISNFQYNSDGKITQRLSVNPVNNNAYRCDFSYNSDGTVLVKGYDGNSTAQTNQMVDRKVFLFPNGDVDKIEEYVVVNGVNHTRTSHYTYDDKNSPSNAILGYNKIKFWDTGTYGNSHNNTSIVFSTTENSNTTSTNLTYTYNSYNYLVTSNYLGISTQYFYQQP